MKLGMHHRLAISPLERQVVDPEASATHTILNKNQASISVPRFAR